MREILYRFMKGGASGAMVVHCGDEGDIGDGDCWTVSAAPILRVPFFESERLGWIGLDPQDKLPHLAKDGWSIEVLSEIDIGPRTTRYRRSQHGGSE